MGYLLSEPVLFPPAGELVAATARVTYRFLSKPCDHHSFLCRKQGSAVWENSNGLSLNHVSYVVPGRVLLTGSLSPVPSPRLEDEALGTPLPGMSSTGECKGGSEPRSEATTSDVIVTTSQATPPPPAAPREKKHSLLKPEHKTALKDFVVSFSGPEEKNE